MFDLFFAFMGFVLGWTLCALLTNQKIHEAFAEGYKKGRLDHFANYDHQKKP